MTGHVFDCAKYKVLAGCKMGRHNDEPGQKDSGSLPKLEHLCPTLQQQLGNGKES